MTGREIRVLIVDSTPVGREELNRALSDERDVAVVGDTPSSKAALDRIDQLFPQIVVLSSSADGLPMAEFTRKALAAVPTLGVLVLIDHNGDVTEEVMAALEGGAFDFVEKPSFQRGDRGFQALRRQLLAKIRLFSAAHFSRMARISTGGSGNTPVEPSASVASNRLRKRGKGADSRDGGPGKKRDVELILVGVSTGGPEALARFIPALPRAALPPVIVAIHMPHQFTASLASHLDAASPLPVREVTDGAALRPGAVYICPGGRHLLLKRNREGQLLARIEDSAPVLGCHPSIDRLFQSAASVCTGQIVAVVLTGMGVDGTRGLGDLKQQGAYVLVQDEESSLIWGMPSSAIRAGLVDEIVPIDRMARRLLRQIERGHA